MIESAGKGMFHDPHHLLITPAGEAHAARELVADAGAAALSRVASHRRQNIFGIGEFKGLRIVGRANHIPVEAQVIIKVLAV